MASHADLLLLDDRGLVSHALRRLLRPHSAAWVRAKVLDLADVSSLLHVSQDNATVFIHSFVGASSLRHMSLHERVLGDEEAATSLLNKGMLQLMVAALLSHLLFHSGPTACLSSDWLIVLGVEANFVDLIDWVRSVRFGTCSLGRCLVEAAGVLSGTLGIDIVLYWVGVSCGLGPRGLRHVTRSND